MGGKEKRKEGGVWKTQQMAGGERQDASRRSGKEIEGTNKRGKDRRGEKR